MTQRIPKNAVDEIHSNAINSKNANSEITKIAKNIEDLESKMLQEKENDKNVCF